jgi:hypothetical protein
MNSFGNLKPTSKTRPILTGLVIFAHNLFCYGLLSGLKPVVDSLINSEAKVCPLCQPLYSLNTNFAGQATSRIFMGDTLVT